MAITLTYGSTQITLPNPRQDDYKAVEILNRRTDYTAARRKRTVKLGVDVWDIRLSLRQLSRAAFDDLYTFFKTTLDWSTRDCTLEDHNGTVYDNMTLQVPPDGLDYEILQGRPLYRPHPLQAKRRIKRALDTRSISVYIHDIERI